MESMESYVVMCNYWWLVLILGGAVDSLSLLLVPFCAYFLRIPTAPGLLGVD